MFEIDWKESSVEMVTGLGIVLPVNLSKVDFRCFKLLLTRSNGVI